MKWPHPTRWMAHLGRGMLWLVGALLGLPLALALALWWWSGTAGSWGQALRWVQATSERYPATLGQWQVDMDDPSASATWRGGGRVPRLRWAMNGLEVQVDGLELQWGGLWGALLRGEGAVIQGLSAQRVRVLDTRAPEPDRAPPTELALPVAVELPFDIAELHYQGAADLIAQELRGHYSHNPQRHHLRLDHLRWADGQYQGEAHLDALAPLRLQATLSGQVRVPAAAGGSAQPVAVNARVEGTLAGVDARLLARMDAPQLQAQATLRPWQSQPLEQASVRMTRFNIAPFWPAGPVTSITGEINAQPSPAASASLWQAQVDVTNTQPGPWDQRRLPVQRLRAHIEQDAVLAQGQRWRLTNLDAVVAQGSLTGQGELLRPTDTAQPLRWSGEIRWRDGRPDALLSHLPAQTADLDLKARQPEGHTQIDLLARMAQATLAAKGRADVSARGFDGQATLSVPGASARLSGRLAAREGAGELVLDLTQAERLLPWLRSWWPAGASPAQAVLRASGQAQATLRWRGGWLNPAALQFDGQADTTRLSLGTAAGEWRLDTRLVASQRQGQATVEAERLSIDARLAHAPALGTRWVLASQQAVTARWNDAGGLEVDSSRWTLEAPTGTALAVTLQPLRWRTQGPGAGLSTQGQVQGIPLAWLDTLPEHPLRELGLSTDLLLDAQWELDWPLATAGVPRARLRVVRRSGDLLWVPEAGATALQAGLRQLSLDAALDGERLVTHTQWDSERAGVAEAHIESRVTRRDGRPDWAADAPLSGTLSARLPQVGVWSALAPPGWRVAGSLNTEARLSGTRAAPLFNGSLAADNLSVRSAVEGIAFVNGRLRATLQGERLSVDTLAFEGSEGAASDGRLSATGSAQWVVVAGQREPRIDLQVRAERLRVSTRADRRLSVSGQLDATLAGANLKLTGDVRADQALILLPDETTPSLGDDVVIRGRSTTPASRSTGARRVVPDVNVNLDLGERFELRGQGLQTRLTGRLNLRSSPERAAPQVLGEVRAVNGSYRAYGQRLDIEEGTLRFTGPYDNPALDVLAIRPFTTQRVGVLVRGTARAPQVRLYAEPDLPDSEKLAWLVLGRSASGGGAEAAVLQQAALALISGGGGPTLGQRLGLDELSVRGGASGSAGSTDSAAAFTLGKRLSSRLYVSYERSLAGVLGSFAMFYDISRRLTLRARAGDDNALELLFTVSYD